MNSLAETSNPRSHPSNDRIHWRSATFPRSQAFGLHRHSPKRQKIRATALQGNQLEKVAEGGIIIGGAGIAGLAAASALQQVGIPAIVLERDSSARLEGSAIGLWPNAFKALDALGVAQPLRDAHSLIQRIQLCTPDGQYLRKFHLDDCEGAPHEFRGVLRKSLLQVLEDSLAPNTVQYSSKITSIKENASGVDVQLEGGESVKGAILLGADGARSEVADYLKLQKPSYAGYSAYRGVAEFDGPLPVADDTVRQMVGKGVRAGMYPLSKKSIYWFVAMNCPQDEHVATENYKSDAARLVKGWQFGIQEAIERSPPESITRSRIGDRWLIPNKTFGKGRISAAGDAAHPMTPNLGQGGCTALEDAVVLAQTLKKIANGKTLKDIPQDQLCKALRDYEAKRSLRVTKITVKSNLMGRILGSSFGPVCAARNAVMRYVYPVKTMFMEHTLYDCGPL